MDIDEYAEYCKQPSIMNSRILPDTSEEWLDRITEFVKDNNLHDELINNPITLDVFDILHYIEIYHVCEIYTSIYKENDIDMLKIRVQYSGSKALEVCNPLSDIERIKELVERMQKMIPPLIEEVLLDMNKLKQKIQEKQSELDKYTEKIRILKDEIEIMKEDLEDISVYE